jgi:hypothetical protein
VAVIGWLPRRLCWQVMWHHDRGYMLCIVWKFYLWEGMVQFPGEFDGPMDQDTSCRALLEMLDTSQNSWESVCRYIVKPENGSGPSISPDEMM